ncbi:hypothetical protein ACJA3J_05800 [Halobacillus sp. SY10]|uniref:hypothetical protein n=1 Tax=Halobacillus sp. SY10 TaxID=3381356 RepID=UPI003879B3EF
MAKKKKINHGTKQSNRAAFHYLQYKLEVHKMAKIGTKKTITVEGIEYTLQHPGSRERMRIQDRAQSETGNPSSEKLAEELFKNVVVEPQVSFEYFDEHDGMEEVITESMKFLRSGK